MEVRIERRSDADSVVHLTIDSVESEIVIRDALALAANAGTVPTWVHGATPRSDEVMADLGFTTDRTLLQMRRPLPAEPSGLDTRAFADDDIEEFVRVNNRAFAWHPEQGGLTPADVRRDTAAPWFDPDGFRIHEIDGRIAGFCWTKIHREPERLGEIYVIGLDPDFHGRGLGGPMTRAGLDWLHEHGETVGMLFVESDNAAAVATYRRLGFDVVREDKLWHPVAP